MSYSADGHLQYELKYVIEKGIMSVDVSNQLISKKVIRLYVPTAQDMYQIITTIETCVILSQQRYRGIFNASILCYPMVYTH